MSITLQALQADGTWSVRNAFITENAKVVSGNMSVDDLEALARRIMEQWQSTMVDGKQLRVHNTDRDEKQPSKSTYVRKIGTGRFEYGFVVRSDNFRKRSDIHTAVGVCDSVADAEAARAGLETEAA